MSAVVTEHSSWKGLLGCLGTGVVVIGLVVWGTVFVLGRNAKKEARIQAEFLDPWVEAVRGAKMAQAWESLTTETYRKDRPQAAVVENYRSAVEILGKPTQVEITSVNSTTELGGGRSFQRAVTRWQWEKKPEVFLTLELVDVPQAGFRLDAARLGGRNKQIPSPNVPAGPW